MGASSTLFPIASYWAHVQGIVIHPSLPGLVVFGFLVGGVTGFFGVGGRLLMSPLLNALFNVPYNVAVGSDLCQMMGASAVNSLRFKRMNSIDYKLGGWMLTGTIIGVEGGVRVLEFLKHLGSSSFLGMSVHYLPLVMTLTYSALLLWIGMIVYREAKASQQEGLVDGIMASLPTGHDRQAPTYSSAAHDFSPPLRHRGHFSLGHLGGGNGHRPADRVPGGGRRIYSNACLNLCNRLSHGGGYRDRSF